MPSPNPIVTGNALQRYSLKLQLHISTNKAPPIPGSHPFQTKAELLFGVTVAAICRLKQQPQEL